MSILVKDHDQPTRARVVMSIHALLTGLALVWVVGGLMMAATGDSGGWFLMGAGLVAVVCVGMDRRVER